MTREEYSSAYVDGCRHTVNFLRSKGLLEDAARENAQAAWARGWECRHQIRDSTKTLAWINSIALNLYRSALRHENRNSSLVDLPVPPAVSLLSLDVRRHLDRTPSKDRVLLARYYFFGYGIRELARIYKCHETNIRVRLFRARRRLRLQFAANELP